MKIWNKGFIFILMVTVLMIGGILLSQKQTVTAVKSSSGEDLVLTEEKEADALPIPEKTAEQENSLIENTISEAATVQNIKADATSASQSEAKKQIESSTEKVEENEIKVEDKAGNLKDEIISELKLYLSQTDLLQGKQGEKGEVGIGKNGADGKDGIHGKDGLDGLKGDTPVKGVDYFTDADIERIVTHVETSIIDSGELTITGLDGKSAYELAVDSGYEGSIEEWLNTLKAKDGMGAYELAVEGGYTGTLEEFLELLATTDASMKTIREDIYSLTNELKTVHQNFQNGCNMIAGEITACGIETASDAGPKTLAENIKKIYTNRYQNGYGKGYLDGAASVNTTGMVTYERHYHTGSGQSGGGCYNKANYHAHSSACYGVCGNVWLDFISDHIDGNKDHRYVYKCGACTFEWQAYSHNGKRMERAHTRSTPRCGYSNNQLLGYALTCGCSDGQILSATITY